jgi:hypothetical protein
MIGGEEMRVTCFLFLILLALPRFAFGYDVPAVSAPVCAYCDAPLTGTTGADHATNCPYYSSGDDTNNNGGSTGSNYTGGNSPLAQLITSLFDRLFAPSTETTSPGSTVFNDDTKKKELKRKQAEFAKSVAGALNLLGKRPVVVAPPANNKNEELTFTGISFFDLGPMVVDLRNVRRATYFVKAVETASTEDVQLLLNEAIKAANGAQSSFGNLTANATVPEINDKGLMAFQQVNIDYAKAYDALLKCNKNFKFAQQHRELVYKTADALRAEVEKNMAGKTDKASLKKKQEMLDEIAAVVQKEEEAWQKAKAQLIAAENNADKAKEESIRVLRALALGKEPADFHPPIASIPALKEETWLDMKNNMQRESKRLDENSNKLGKELASFVPPLKVPERIHEGVIMGFGTDANDAKKMATDGVSCFTGKTFAEMNKTAEQARNEGKDIGGTMVVSFGTSKEKLDYTTALKYGGSEAKRVFLDHLANGNYSLDTPQGRDAVKRLAGKEFDRLIAHSNGATITEALINNDIIKVDELNIVGGDRSMVNGNAYQKLLDSGKVKRIVVWINVNDPVPGLTSFEPFKLVESGADVATHLAKKIIREMTNTNTTGVEYRYMYGSDYSNPAGADQVSLIAAHFIEESYLPGMANELGVKYVPPKRILKKK